jgi:hypothetical protein
MSYGTPFNFAMMSGLTNSRGLSGATGNRRAIGLPDFAIP